MSKRTARRAIVWGMSTGLALCVWGCRKDHPNDDAQRTRAAMGKRAAPPQTEPPVVEPGPVGPAAFEVQSESFADVRILRYRVPGFEELDLRQKELLYYLYEAALSGRDIIWDQNYRWNLVVRKVLEALVRHPPSDAEDPRWKALLVYAKRVWFSNGIHHHYSNKKMLPEVEPSYVEQRLRDVPLESLPLDAGETLDAFVRRLMPIVFDPGLDAKKVNLDPHSDLVATSATNFYGPGVTQKDVERFYARKVDGDDPHPVLWGLNSQLVKEGGKVRENVWKVGGMYGPAIERIVFWLEKAAGVAENELQRTALEKLVAFYRSGDLSDFDAYSIAWVEDADSRIDVVNGFIEVYGDPMAYRGSFESIVSFKDMVASRRIAAISSSAAWFETHSPIDDAYKKEDVRGISAKVITVVVEGGDAAPMSAIGINLPNSHWIRAEHGSKSVNLGNIVAAYEEARKTTGTLAEFAFSAEEVERQRKHGALADALHTDLHEVIGHASGKIRAGVGRPKDSLKNYGSTIEEVRADLVALYYAIDPKLIELGVMDDLEVGRAAYDAYLRTGLMVQLARLELGEDLEEAHMRCRQLISRWVLEHAVPGEVIERQVKGAKTYFVVRDHVALRRLFGELLREVQRMTSEGDFAAARALVEQYGVKVDPELHREVKARYDALNIAPYAGFIQPRLVPVLRGEVIDDVRIEYPEDFAAQMLEYGDSYAFLPVPSGTEAIPEQRR